MKEEDEEFPWEKEDRSQEDINLLKEIAKEVKANETDKHSESTERSGAT